MIRGDLKKLKDLKWEIFRVREEVKDKDVRDELGKVLYKIVDIVEEYEKKLVFKILEEREKKIDERGLKIMKGVDSSDNERSFVEVE